VSDAIVVEYLTGCFLKSRFCRYVYLTLFGSKNRGRRHLTRLQSFCPRDLPRLGYLSIPADGGKTRNRDALAWTELCNVFEATYTIRDLAWIIQLGAEAAESFESLVVAGQRNDVEMGRRAIDHIYQTDFYVGGTFSGKAFWEKMLRLPMNWRDALLCAICQKGTGIPYYWTGLGICFNPLPMPVGGNNQPTV